MGFEGYHKLRILVIDDFDNFRVTVGGILSELGVGRVDMLPSGDQVIACCKDNRYDILLCDYNLGSGKNGLQLLEELRFRKLLPASSLFILVSAESSKDIVLASKDYAPDAYLTKPITGQILSQRLERLLLQRQEMSELNQLLDRNKTAEAIALCEQNLKSKSRYLSLYQRSLGDLYLQAGEIDKAEAVYEGVIAQRELDWAVVGLAKVRKARGQLEEVEEELEHLIKQSPHCMAAYDVLADVYAERGEGDLEQALVEKAVNVSPMAFLRQQRLADVAGENGDNLTSAAALRRLCKLGENSCYDKVENHINFCRKTAELINDRVEGGGDLLRDALAEVARLESRYQLTEQQKLQGMFLKANLIACQGENNRAALLLKDAVSYYDVLEPESGIDAQIDYFNALKASKQDAKARQYMKELVDRHSGNQEALMKLDRYLDEPVSNHNVQQVAKLNAEGIELYSQSNFIEAIACFRKAMRLFPRHPGVQLNLLQSILGEMKTFGIRQEKQNECEGLLEHLRGLSNTDEQYPRFLQLRDKFQQLIHHHQH